MSRSNPEIPPIRNEWADLESALSHERPVDEPLFPVLHKSEVDLSDKATFALKERLTEEDRLALRAEEKVVAIEEKQVDFPAMLSDPDDVLRLSCNAETLSEIGLHGPSGASVNIKMGGEVSRYDDPHYRDSSIAAQDVKDIYPSLLDAVIEFGAKHQGVENEAYIPGQPYGFEKPGSIVLVKRKNPDDPVAVKFMNRQGWEDPFYASADAPGRFLNDIATAVSRDPGYLNRKTYSSRAGYEAPLQEAFDLSCRWFLDRAAENPEGLIEYRNPVQGGGGMRHQGWRDSAGAMPHADGTWANSENGVVSTEVLAVSYDACLNSAEIQRNICGNEGIAMKLEEIAFGIKKFFLENGWVDDPVGGYFALGFDRNDNGKLRPLQVKTPMPDLLRSRLLKTDNPETKQMTMEYMAGLLNSDILTKWGMRSMSSRSVSYGPKRYHEGLIWNHINLAMADSFSQHGLFGIDRFLADRTAEVCNLTRCYAETIVGDNTEVPKVLTSDVYVYNELQDETYRFIPSSPLWQTWVVTGMIARRERNKRIPESARDPVLIQTEARLLNDARELVLSV